MLSTSWRSIVHGSDSQPQVRLPPRGHLTLSEDILGYHSWVRQETTGIQWVEARNTATCPAMHRAAPTTKNYPAQHGAHAEVEEPRAQRGNTGLEARDTGM